MNTKHQLYHKCEDYIDNRLDTIQNIISDIEQGFRSETKSSAGDKHETGRAMLQLEREKVGQQLAEAQKLQELLKKINTKNQSQIVVLGSVVYTTQFNYFIAISAGKIKIGKEQFYAISPSTPIAKLLLSKEVGNCIEFRTTKFSILEIL